MSFDVILLHPHWSTYMLTESGAATKSLCTSCPFQGTNMSACYSLILYLANFLTKPSKGRCFRCGTVLRPHLQQHLQSHLFRRRLCLVTTPVLAGHGHESSLPVASTEARTVSLPSQAEAKSLIVGQLSSPIVPIWPLDKMLHRIIGTAFTSTGPSNVGVGNSFCAGGNP